MNTYVKHSERTVRKGCRTCKRTDLYWGHDTSREAERYCSKCTVGGKWVMIERDGALHACFANGHDQTPEDHAEPQEASEPKPASPVFGGVAGDSDAALGAFKAFIDLLAPKVDATQVEDIVSGKLGDFSSDLISTVGKVVDGKLTALTLPTVVEVTWPDGNVTKVDGASHSIMPNVLKLVSRRQHVLMVGPAGTGKSKIAHQVSEALELPYSEISLSPDRSTSALLGYLNAVGEYVTTEYRKRFEQGGVMHFDELDNAHPSVLAVINAGLANGHAAFPDGMVKRHPDFVCVASANTFGNGPDRAYVGRQAIDKATLNRFLVVPVGYDEALERVVCQGSGASDKVIDEVLRYVRALRRNAELHKLPVVLGTRNAKHLCVALDSGIAKGDAIEYAVRVGMSDQDWSKLNSGVSKLSI